MVPNIDQMVPNGVPLSSALVDPTLFFPLSNGMKCDGKALSDITTTTGAGGTAASASYTFVQGDIGKLITIAGAGAAAAVLNTSIASVSAGKAVLTTAPSTVLSGNGVATFGTDDTAAFQTMVNAAAIAGPGGGKIMLPLGIIVMSSVTWKSNVSLQGQGAGKSILKYIKTTDAAGAMIYQNVGAAYYYDCQFSDFEMDMSAATAAVYNVYNSCIRIVNAVRLKVHECYIHDSPATGLAFDYAVACEITNNIVYNCGRLASGQIGGAGIGCAISSALPASGMGLNAQQSWIVVGNYLINNVNYAAFWEAEVASTQYAASVICNDNIILLNASSVAGIGDCGCSQFEAVGNHLYATAANSGPAITSQSGTTGYSPGVQGIIEDNVIYAVGSNGIYINYTVTVGAVLCAYKISGNKISGAAIHGIKINSNASDVLNTMLIQDNLIYNCVQTALAFTGAGGHQDVVVKDNVFFNNCVAGSGATTASIDLASTIARLRMIGNMCFDNGTGTQKYAVAINATITAAYVVDNDFSGNASGAFNNVSGSIAGILMNNKGYNPVGASAAGVGGSPWTFIAPSSPGTLYISSSGTITAVTQNGTSIFTQALTTQDFIIPFNANDSIVITYTGVLTGIKMVN